MHNYTPLKKSIQEKQTFPDEVTKKINKLADKKITSLYLAESFSRIGQTTKSLRVSQCNNWMQLGLTDRGKCRLLKGNFCQVRLCPNCTYIRGRKVYRDMYNFATYMQKNRKDLTPLFLTLTFKNCKGRDLKREVEKILKAWKFFYDKTKEIKENFVGWFRGLEVTYNLKNDTYHPHLHILFYVKKSYFDINKDNFLTTEDFSFLWKKAAKLDYEPICDVRKVKANNKQSIVKVISELTKYTVKDSDIIIFLDEKKTMVDKVTTDKVVETLSKALERKRLFASGGIVKKILADLKIDLESMIAETDEVIIAIFDFFWSKNSYCLAVKRTTEFFNPEIDTS